MTEKDEGKLPDDALWEQLSERLRQSMGLDFTPKKRLELKHGIAALAQAEGMASAEDCARWLLSANLTQKQIEMLAKQLTIGETYFFRDPQSYQLLEKKILPALISKRGNTHRLRIWSAGCSSGEEPYSIAIVLKKLLPELSRWHITVLGTDITPDLLQKAAKGVYREWSFRSDPQDIKTRYFKKTPSGQYKIADDLREMVSLSYLNLVTDEYPSTENNSNAMDIIFCRNVLMYFEQSQAEKVIMKLSKALVDGGWLFLSPMDISSQTEFPQLTAIHFNGITLYKKVSRKLNHSLQERIDEVFNIDLPLEEPVKKEPLLPTGQPLANDYEQAEVAYQQGRYNASRLQLLKYLKHTPRQPKAMILLAKNHANLGQLAEAQQWCEKALALDKMHSEWWYLYANILQEEGFDTLAYESLRRSLYLDQQNVLTLFSMGNLLVHLQKPQEAEGYLKDALALLKKFHKEEILPDSDSMTAGRLQELIKFTLTTEVRS